MGLKKTITREELKDIFVKNMFVLSGNYTTSEINADLSLKKAIPRGVGMCVVGIGKAKIKDCRGIPDDKSIDDVLDFIFSKQ